MKLNFRTILIVFLVSMLGAGLSTAGVMELYNKNRRISTTSSPVISEITYSNVEKTDLTKAIEKAYQSVVEITVTYETTSYNWFMGNQTSIASAKGSGVIISDDGYIVTNDHVVSKATGDGDIEIKLATGDVVNAELIGKDSRTDLAVLKIDVIDAKYSSFVNSDELVLGQEVIAIGNPLGDGLACSNGIVSALSREIYINNVYMTVIQTNAAINEGNSGGGLFDINGNLVGIVNAKSSGSALNSATVEGMGYAIPANTVKRIINELIENGYVKDRAALGISVYSSYQIEGGGVLVASVVEGGGAQQAGIEVNDIITAVNDVEINSYADLSKILDSKLVGDTVTIKVTRGEEKLSFDVKLGQSVN